MIALSLLAAVLQATAPTPPAAPPVPTLAEPPHDWSTLAAITLPPAGPELVRFVREEVASGRCPRAKATDEQMVLVVPLAVRVGPDGIANSVVPLAIGCPTVEQYSAGVAQRMIRHLTHRTMMAGDRWYRTVITYTWPG
ncbi:hypothetical protein NZL82_12935 [Sphingomonas sanguinis]|uniref:hypothetical protein n=1 Tax=Sphingomonas sp. LC-1 TaxID=3110957 RepID=UPI0021BB456B|nr:hypothetical protein [Sphingomonas sp. LC-1]MCT8002780.1 hypothetical protein [Sphingomonas sp. LC-1]